MNEQKLNKKLAKWAGFKQRGVAYAGSCVWVSPEELEWFDKVMGEQQGKEYQRMPDKDIHYAIPDFTSSLDLCFKWLVPKCDCYGLTLDMRDNAHIAWVEKNNFIYGTEKAETPALALCLAIEKLIDETTQENTDYEWSKVQDKYGGEAKYE